jgi:hypothetical protein
LSRKVTAMASRKSSSSSTKMTGKSEWGAVMMASILEGVH